jgi:hypothetical protein
MIIPAVQIEKEKTRTTKLEFNKLISYLKFSFSILPDERSGYNTIYSIQDAALSAFSVFFTQCPSFLAYQTQMQETKGENNAFSLFQISKIPSDNQVRNLLDPINPSNLDRVYEHIYEELRVNGYLERYRSCLEKTLLIPMDGVCYHSSETIFCEKCSHQQHKNGSVTHTHSAITPVIVAPGNKHVITLPPEFITPQDGHNKQDSEQAAIRCELVTTNADGKIIYRNSFITDHLIRKGNIVDVIKAGRARWKIENENNNTLKTKGYNLEHNFGHGDQYLSQTLLSMNLLAFLFHTVLNLIDISYQLIRAKLPSRKTFFDDIRALTRYMYFDDWQALMNFMMFGLKIKHHNSS